MNIFKIKYFVKHWKMGVHLLFYTKRFGVNNQWWSDFDGYFSWTLEQRIINILKVKPIISNFQRMKMRMSPGFGFVSKETWDKLYPKKK